MSSENHPRIDPAAVAAGSDPTRSLSPAAALVGQVVEIDTIVDCPTCGKPAAQSTLRTKRVDAGAWFGLRQPEQLLLSSRHCARSECRAFCESLLRLAEGRVRGIVARASKPGEA